MPSQWILPVAIVTVVGVAVVLWALYSRRSSQRALEAAHRDAERIREEAQREVNTKLREAEVAAKEHLSKMPAWVAH